MFQFARTLICQATLAPLTPIAMPTYWDHDCALSLYPLPDVIVIGDPSQAFDTIQQGCTIINSVSFCFRNIFRDPQILMLT